MMSFAADKASLRAEFGAKRMALTPAELLQKQEAIASLASQLNIPSGGIWMLFKPMTHHNEIDPLAFAESMAYDPTKRFYVFPSIKEEGVMDARLVNSSTLWEKNSWKIPEPQNGAWVAPQWIKVMIVPLLAFDKRGYRVGFGKGYYDRFIARCSPNLITVGLSYFDAVDVITNVMPFDKPLSYCVTPHQVYGF